MIRLSSIFSFRTLRSSLRPGSAVVFALALIGMAEIGVRHLTPNLGWYEGLSSLGQWVGRLEHELKTHQPDIWLMGNSVLAYGVDVAALEYQTGKTAVAMPFGGATVAGSTAMLEYYIKRAPHPPKHVLYCITKDDLNLHGERAWISTKYLEYETWKGLSFDRIFRLADSRNTILNYLKSGLFGHPTASAMQPSEPPFGGVASEEKLKYMGSLMQNFELDSEVFDRIRSLATRHGFDVTFLLMPVSDIYLQYHDQHGDGVLVEQVHSRIRDLSMTHRFAFVDLSGMFPHEYDYFSDPYHLTPDGRKRATEAVAQQLGVVVPDVEPRRIACIGDSITYGAGLPDRFSQSYPAILEQMANRRLEVGNFGVSGTTLLKNSRRAWVDTPAFAEAVAFAPDMVIIMFGINDLAHPEILDQFEQDGVALVTRFFQLPSVKRVYICTPTPLAPPKLNSAANQTIRDQLIPQIYRIADRTQAEVVDINSKFPNTQRLLPDTTHPNAAGAKLIAAEIFSAMKSISEQP